MKNRFVPFELAQRLVDLGFIEPCLAWYDLKGNFNMLGQENEPQGFVHTTFQNPEIVSAPMWGDVIKWLRDKHMIFVTVWVDRTMEPKYCYSIYQYSETLLSSEWHTSTENSDLFYSYTRAEQEGITKALDLVKPEFIKLLPIVPIGSFILGQEDITPVMGNDGAYYHYSSVCTLLKRYEKILKS